MAGRALYDAGYIAGGCVGDPPPDTASDNTDESYMTDFAIGIVGIVMAFLIFKCRCRCKPEGARRREHDDEKLSAGFMLFTGLGYGMLGFMHRIVFYEEDEVALGSLAYGLILVGNAFLGAIGLGLCTPFAVASQLKRGGTLWSGTKIIYIFLNLVIILHVGYTYNVVLSGIVCCATHTTLMMLWSSRSPLELLLKAGGMVLCVSGFAVQGLLSFTCGRDAYADCFRNCPLPAPDFDHNALFHMLYMMGLLSTGIGCLAVPDFTTKHVEISAMF